MSRLVMPLTKIVITGNKGGTGKTTIAALLAEYLNHQNKKVQLIDTDPNQALQAWVNNCLQEKRPVSSPPPVDYQITDTAGVSGGYLTHIKQANIILVPFVPHYVDLQVIIPWFQSLPKEQQNKVYFLPNRYQKTKEQREGLNQLNETRRDMKAGTVLSPLSQRPALYGSLLNGSPANFFSQKESPQAQEVFQQLFKHYEKNH
ncbi:ParA family protein [endosymbiont GvMRE of Glomus versiforme]|uniref:ParA family protein n=1 Tax=endosymbiont GvMRE of Glomus versiforme TaxID=2039283 RepID=UPI000EDB95B9|nr:ParA family protein [endosymbiont GvMRE of Glomus versiforme]RHZ35891.1 Chromosome partitioning protein ParA [endosymbiont GvMRE of Glomus versiforme]